jgi:hypothetical protein
LFELIEVYLENWEPGYLSGKAMGYRLDDRGFDFRQELEIFLITTATRPALGLIEPPIQWVPRALSLEVKRPGCEDDHSTPSSAEVKNLCGAIPPLPQYAP